MDDATLARWLAFAHPVWMSVSLGLAVATARLGLEIRNRRRRGQAVGRALRDRHLRLGRSTLALVVVGFAAGPPSMAWLRDRPVFESLHAVLGLIVLGLFLWTGWSGRALAAGNPDARDVHRIAAAASIAAALLSAVAGFRLLP
jgi:hypothetical protein